MNTLEFFSVYCFAVCLQSYFGAGLEKRINDQAPSSRNPQQSPYPPLLFSASVPLFAAGGGKHYLVEVTIGTIVNSTLNASSPSGGRVSTVGRRQTVRLVFDTGSGDVVVFGRYQCEQRDPAQGLEHQGGLEALPPCFDFRDSASFKFDQTGFNRRACVAGSTGQGAVCQEALLIDGYKAEVFCETASDKLVFTGLDGLAGVSPVRGGVCVANDSVTDGYKMRYWNGTQGSLGMFFQICSAGSAGLECVSPYPTLMASLPADGRGPRRSIFALDLNQPSSPSRLAFGPPLGGWPGVAWSESQPVTLHLAPQGSSANSYAFHSFEMFDLSLCGARLFGNLSSHWMAMIDTGAACLTLPQEMFDALEAWVPGMTCVQEHVEGFDYTECTDSACKEDKKRLTICYLKDGVSPSDLPTISFRLQDGGDPLFLPLSGLVLNDRPSGRPRVCVSPTDSVASYQTEQLRYLLLFPKISLGTLALRNLLTIFDLEAMAIGMRNKYIYDLPTPLSSTFASLSATSPASTGSVGGNSAGGLGLTGCASPKVCVGAQSFYAPTNSCLDPPCDLLYFHEVNPETKTCRVQTAFVVCGVLLLVCLAAAEIMLSEIYERLARKLIANFALST